MTSVRINRMFFLLVCCLLAFTGMQAQEDRRIFYTFDASMGLADNSAQTLMCTKTGRMVISTIGHVNFYNGDAFTHIDPQPEDVFPLPKYNGHYHLYFDTHHHLWLKDKRSVTCVNLLSEHFIQDIGGVFRELGMLRPVDDLFCDHNNHLWLLSGSMLYGVDDHVNVPVSSSSELQDIDVYNHRQLLQFYANGRVSAYDLKSGRHLYDADAFADNDSVKYSASSVLCADKNHYYQIRNGEKSAVLLLFDTELRTWKRLLTMPYHLNNMEIHDGKLFIASEYGYWTYNVTSGDTEHIEYLKLTGGRRLLTDVNTVAFDRQGGMWLGTEKRGLLYSKPYASPFFCYTWDDPEAMRYSRKLDELLPPSESLGRHVNCKLVDSRGWTWTGLYTGLQLVKSDGKSSYLFTKRDGLLNEMIHSVVEDDQHDIWVSTSFGISHLFIREDSVYHVESYSARDNVPNESFVNGRAAKLGDGTIVMQALDHVVVFNPSHFHSDLMSKMVIYPKLIKVMINGHFVSFGTKIDNKVMLDRAVSRTYEIVVDYSQNSLSLTFSALNFMRPLQTFYRYRVKGLDNQWRVLSYYNSNGLVDSNGLLHVPLLGLSPGTYTIELQSSMDPEVWPYDPYVWNIVVKQPWWRATGVYILLGFLIVSLLALNFFFYNRNMRLSMLRHVEEDDILKRLRAYAKNCEAMLADANLPVSTSAAVVAEQDESADQFVEAMLKIIPYLREHEDRPVSLRRLSELTGVETSQLIKILSDNFYKSPQHVAVRLKALLDESPSAS